MSKRRVASILMFKKKNALKYPVKIVAIASGTGTATNAGIVSVLAASGATVATKSYLTIAATTAVGTLVGTAAVTY